MAAAKTGAERQAAHRARGRTFTVTLTDKAAIAVLDQLIAKHGGVTAAIVAALKGAYAERDSGR